jgi:peroxiredoxin
MRRELGVGKLAPKLELPTETGQMVSIASLRGRGVLVSFLSHAASRRTCFSWEATSSSTNRAYSYSRTA